MPVLDQPLTAHETLETEELEGLMLEKVFRCATRVYKLLRDIDELWASEQALILIALKSK